MSIFRNDPPKPPVVGRIEFAPTERPTLPPWRPWSLPADMHKIEKRAVALFPDQDTSENAKAVVNEAQNEAVRAVLCGIAFGLGMLAGVTLFALCGLTVSGVAAMLIVDAIAVILIASSAVFGKREADRIAAFRLDE